MIANPQYRKNARTLPIVAIAIALLLAIAALSLTMGASATERLTPREFLNQFNGRRLPNQRAPRDDEVAAMAAGVQLGSTVAEARVDQWYADFFAQNFKSGPNPIAYAERMAIVNAAEREGEYPRPLLLGPNPPEGEVGTAKMLMIPFEFTGTDTLDVCDAVGGNSVGTTTVTGPLFGTIPDPSAEGDNNTIWTDNFDIEWYEDLMFGDGVGVVRTDLNGGAGVDMTGISARNWYLEQSEGRYDLQGEIYPDRIQLDHSVAYYGWGNELNPEGTGYPCNGTNSGFGFEFTIDIADQLNAQDPDFDWAQYDVDGDGVVDHLMVIHAGVDNSAGGGTYGNYQLWAHSWDVYCDNNGDGDVFDPEDYGCMVDDGGTPGDDSDDIYIANYTHVPEDADIGVVVHEYGHDIGLPDYYDQTGATSNSTAHWIVMSGGSWSGALGGSHPAPFNPWARYFFGWARPKMIDYDAPMETFKVGQSDPTPANTYDSLWVNLPDQAVSVENMAGPGAGLHTILGNNLSSGLSAEFDLSGTAAPVMTFSAYVDIEEDWDYAYVQASADGVTWDVLLNDEGFYGTVDLNGTSTWMGIGGLTGAYDGTLTYDLSSYAGDSSVWVRFLYATDAAVQNPGMWLDDLAIDDGASSIYSTDFEDNSDWTNAGWEVVPYDEFTPHYYLVEWRNDTGSIASEGHTQQYYSLAHDGTGWNVDKFSANVPGMLIWYRNTMYNNNQAVNGGREFASPATGPKGELLLVDANYDPVTWSGGFWISGTNGSTVFTTDATFSNRRGAMDGAYSLEDSVAWWLHDYHDSDNDVMDFGSKDAVTGFHDSTGSVPGWVWSGDGFVYRADMASSVVIPAWADYTTKIRGLGEPFDVDTDLVGMEIGDDFTAFWGFTVGGQELGSGNPGDTDVQYGLHIEIVEEAADGTWGKIKVWNAHNDVYASGGEGMAMLGGIDGNARYHFTNVGSPLEAAMFSVELPAGIDYVDGSVSAGWTATEDAGVVTFTYTNVDTLWAGDMVPDMLAFDYGADYPGDYTPTYTWSATDVAESDSRDLPALRATRGFANRDATAVSLANMTTNTTTSSWLPLLAVMVTLTAGVAIVLRRRNTTA